MTVYIESVQHLHAIRARLEANGWTLTAASAGGLLARHRDLPDERTLRMRLHALGLLTSSGLRMEFRPPGRWADPEA
jgi:hypothetical protein